MDNINALPPASRGGIDHIGDVLAFVRVADAQSFTVAAERLGLSRSAVGKCISRLEQSLGARLLHRSTRNVSLSDEGRLFYEHAQRILSEVDNAADAMASRKQAPRGRLRIDLPVSLGRLHIMPLLREYLRRWPGVEADVSFSDDYTDLVREGIDVAIRLGGDVDSRLVRKVLAPHRLITCAAPQYLDRHGVPATPEDLGRHQAIAFTHAGALVPWRFLVNGQERNAQVAGRLRMGNTEALRDAALAGDGIVQVGAFLVGDDLRAGRLKPVLESAAPAGAPVCAVYPHRRHLAPKVRVLIDEIAARWSAGAPWADCANPPRA
ncbi:LysR family transcriptional regulator [Achromobacter deleyi]|uniref:LysR family transcriptional regulator n=1 Tax=Achromobacter deleyi TaxID=1353891 RepID=UPI00149133F7|nr:LysR family transcriptional regulator [Achromobacter deleyi]QVQ28908.1 LysR family transcriptional regulator [Achromobacter deleyi]UIP19022.1 LysR family transcriptional regulator [Achromobacter deleyi]